MKCMHGLEGIIKGVFFLLIFVELFKGTLIHECFKEKAFKRLMVYFEEANCDLQQ